MKIIWSIPASNDFETAIEYIAADRPQAARRLSQLTRKAMLLLRRHPRIGKPGRLANTRELSLSNMPYVVIYRMTDGSIEILRFLHHRRLWPIPDIYGHELH